MRVVSSRLCMRHAASRAVAVVAIACITAPSGLRPLPAVAARSLPVPATRLVVAPAAASWMSSQPASLSSSDSAASSSSSSLPWLSAAHALPAHGPHHPSRTLLRVRASDVEEYGSDERDHVLYVRLAADAARNRPERDIYVLGTSHTSHRSIDDVKQVIEVVAPGSIMVELDSDRAAELLEDDEAELDDSELSTRTQAPSLLSMIPPATPLPLPHNLHSATSTATLSSPPSSSSSPPSAPSSPAATSSPSLPAPSTPSSSPLASAASSSSSSSSSSFTLSTPSSLAHRLKTGLVRWHARRYYASIERKHVNIQPGAELRLAMREAQKRGAQLVLGDIDYEESTAALGAVTSFRMLWRLRLWNEAVNSHALHSERELSGDSQLPMMKAVERSIARRANARQYRKRLAQSAPEVAEAMFGVRERALFDAILNRCTAPVTVAVVGAMHLPGIEDLFRLHSSADSPPAAPS